MNQLILAAMKFILKSSRKAWRVLNIGKNSLQASQLLSAVDETVNSKYCEV